MKKILAKREATLLIAILIVAAITTVINPQFLTPFNLINIISTNAANAIMAVGMTAVLIVGGIDISVSAQLVTVGVLAGKLMQMQVLNVFTMFLAFFIIGGLLGGVNGTLVARTNLPPIIVSLAMMNIFRGFILDWTRGSWLMGLPRYFLTIGTGKWLGIPISIYILAVAALSMHLILRYTKIGRQIYAVGGNKTAAVRMGVSLSKVYIFVFASLGALTGIAAIVYFSPSGAILPTAANGLEMTIVASVVLGGTSINGGKGNVLSTLLGVLLLGLIQNALVLAHVQAYWQNILNGICIVIPVIIDALNTKREQGEYRLPHIFGRPLPVKAR
ncbi:MAG: ABC transporter permease [Clostridia bacterium]